MQRRQEFWRLFWLIVATAIVVLPHLPYMPLWISITLCVAAGWRLAAAEHGWRLPGMLIRLPLLIAALAGVLWTYQSISGIEAGTALLLVLLALKLLETRAARDRTLVAIILFILMFSAFLREQAIWSAGYLLAGVAVCVIALLQADGHQERLSINASVRYMSRLMLQALPLMALLFVLFPRVPGPFWALPTDSGAAQTGLGETVRPGDITALGRSDELAFRVRFLNDVPPPAQRYWRGPVMSYFDGRSWSWKLRGMGPENSAALRTEGPRYQYEIMLEPHGRQWLLALESPHTWDMSSASFSPDWQLIDSQPITDRLVYRATSVVNGTIPGNDPQRYLQAMRYLPASSNPRSNRLARELRGKFSDDEDYLRAILRIFSAQQFFYTLTPPALGSDPVDEFLFETRAGFCEHYASAFAVLARAGGIPARLVTGYLGAEKNPLSDYWQVRQSDAHAWTEVWINGEWRRYDPTAAVAPERVELGLDSAIPDAGRSTLSLIRRSDAFGQVALSMDAINAAWDEWVLAFGPDAQLALLQNLGISRPDSRHLLIAAMLSCAAFLGALGWALGRPAKTKVDNIQQLYLQFCARLRRIFRARQPYEAPADYAHAVAAERPDLAPDIREITELYLALRYDDSPHNASRLQQLVRRFRPRR